MTSDLISVVLIGHADPDAAARLRLDGMPPTVADGFSALVIEDDRELASVLADEMAHVIFTFGDIDSFPILSAAPIEIRRRWTHFDDRKADPGQMALLALNGFIDVVFNDRFPDQPLVSVFTPAYMSGDRIERAYRSLCAQSYRNWEWIVYDDSPDEDTFDRVSSLGATDPRVHLFRSDSNCGVIGEVKRRCCALARGSILVELDHDDELTQDCLQDLVAAFAEFPDAGFAYSDCAEIYENGQNATYGETYAFGFGSYRAESYMGHNYMVTNYPEINAKTVRNIVGMPNHVRAWRTSAYHAAGGYNPEIHVADDYELCIRTFLTTRMVHVKRFGYIQYLSNEGSNTQRLRNKEIQRLVNVFAANYESRIHARFEELGIDDFIHSSTGLDWDAEIPESNRQANLDFQ